MFYSKHLTLTVTLPADRAETTNVNQCNPLTLTSNKRQSSVPVKPTPASPSIEV